MVFGGVFKQFLKLVQNVGSFARNTKMCENKHLKAFFAFSRKNWRASISLAIVSKRAKTRYLERLDHFPHSAVIRRHIRNYWGKLWKRRFGDVLSNCPKCVKTWYLGDFLIHSWNSCKKWALLRETPKCVKTSIWIRSLHFPEKIAARPYLSQ